ncbi:MAG: class I SAM-dependent methyltransferase [Planctomycetota bacterium]
MSDYDSIGHGYARFRQSDERIAAAIDAALGDAASVANIGAGTGSYEPAGRDVIAVEPSEVMIAQRAQDAARCLKGTAEAIPLDDSSVDAGMAVLSSHHWADLSAGLAEMARVVRKRVVIMTWVPDAAPCWLTEDYFPEILEYDRSIFPSSDELAGLMTARIGPTRLVPLPVPHDCTDGFLFSYWRRPELYLDSERRDAISSFGKIDAEAGVRRLQADLQSGAWGERNAGITSLNTLDVGYRLACADVPADRP